MPGPKTIDGRTIDARSRPAAAASRTTASASALVSSYMPSGRGGVSSVTVPSRRGPYTPTLLSWTHRPTLPAAAPTRRRVPFTWSARMRPGSRSSPAQW